VQQSRALLTLLPGALTRSTPLPVPGVETVLPSARL
jgi:hypothetical protein